MSCVLQDPASLVLTGREIVAANLFSRGIEESGVAAEGLPRIVRGFPAKVGILHEATPLEKD